MKLRDVARCCRVVHGALICAVAACVGSCSEETDVERIGASRIIPSVKVAGSVITAQGVDGSLLIDVPEPEELSFSVAATDGKYSHTWPSVKDYPLSELLRPSSYTVSAAYGSELDEGFDKPYFQGLQLVSLASGAEAEVNVVASLASAMFKAGFDEMPAGFREFGLMLHSESYSYVAYPSSEEGRAAYLHPGNVSVALSATDDEGNEAMVELCEIPGALSRHLYDVEVATDGEQEPTVTLKVNGVFSGSVTLSREFMLSAAPVISTRGFESSESIELTEGETPDETLRFEIGGSEPKSLLLTTVTNSMPPLGWPAQIDLVKASAAELARLEELGLELERDTDGQIRAVGFDNVVSKLRYSSSAPETKFILVATGANGKMSDPSELAVKLQPVSLSVRAVSDIIIGVDMAELTLVCREGDVKKNLSIEARNDSGAWEACEITDIEETGEGLYSVKFKVPLGTQQTVSVRVLYMGAELNSSQLKRVTPTYDVDIDAFALSAMIYVKAEDESLTSLITSLLRVYVDNRLWMESSHEDEEGVVRIGPLEPNRSYTITTTLMSDPQASDFTAAQSVKTERMLQVKNNTFEDHEDGIVYNNLRSGGRYSQSIADVFNCQNHTSFKVQRPRDWANTNAKTFCTAAKNPNTWYMAPSVMSDLDNVQDYYAIKLQSVGWDVDGEAIPDYRQKPGQFLAYNPNVPTIKHRAAGKVFLGKYSFDAKTLKETYTEGIEFTSRPVAVNGNYHFSPCTADLYDTGYIAVEVLGEQNGMEIAIAQGELQLPVALSYTAFTVPLTYNNFGVKATRLKIMLSSSRHVGSIDYESAHVVTMDDPVKATSTGGILWVQDITLSYF